MIYLDHAAGSFPKAPGVADAMVYAVERGGGNINRSTYALSTDTALRVMEVREALADFFGCSAAERLVFTPGATYGINAVMRGLLRPGDHLVISAMEHNAVWRTASALAEQGVGLSVAPCRGDGGLDIAALEKLLRAETKLVMLAHASNVNGVIQDVPAAAEICSRRGVMLALDAAQSAGHIPIDMEGLGVDAVCFPGHKGLCGPQGVGGLALSVRLAERVSPYVAGGTGSLSSSEKMPAEFPDRLEPGTPNLPGILGLGAALEHIGKTGLSSRRAKELELTARLLDGLSRCGHIRVPGPASAEGRVGVVSVDFLRRDNAEVAAALERGCGILTRCGLHCAPLAHRTLGTFPQGTVRFSLGFTSTTDEVDAAVAAALALA